MKNQPAFQEFLLGVRDELPILVGVVPFGMIYGILALGAVAGALTTMQISAVARSSLAPLPLEELQQLAAVFGMVKSDYVEPVDEKKLISDAISGMVSGLTRKFSRRRGAA